MTRERRSDDLPDGIDFELPVPGRITALVLTSARCAPCSRVISRLERLDGVTVQRIEVAGREAMERLGVDRIPELWLVGAGGDVIRHWVGEPLAGTLERTVAAALGP